MKVSWKDLFNNKFCSSFNIDKALEAIELFQGIHDFASFTFDAQLEEFTMRNLEIELKHVDTQIGTSKNHFRNYDVYEFRFKSSSFLRNQVSHLLIKHLLECAIDLLRSSPSIS